MSHESPLETQDWSGAMGQRWLANLDAFEGMIAPIGAEAVKAGAFRPGERVVDIGCGAGPTTLDIARRVSPGGVVVGVDVSPDLIKVANQRSSKAARAPSAARVRFAVADAATASLPEAPFDVLFSRFGVMFFKDPYDGFAHMRTWLKPGGRIAFCCWAPPRENPWVAELEQLIRRYVTPPDPVPNAPGPFGLADIERTKDILAKGGFVDVAVQTWRGEQPVAGPGATPAQAAEFAMNGMHVGQLLSDEPDDVKAKARADLEKIFAAKQKPGGIMLPSTAYIVTGKAK